MSVNDTKKTVSNGINKMNGTASSGPSTAQSKIPIASTNPPSAGPSTPQSKIPVLSSNATKSKAGGGEIPEEAAEGGSKRGSPFFETGKGGVTLRTDVKADPVLRSSLRDLLDQIQQKQSEEAGGDQAAAAEVEKASVETRQDGKFVQPDHEAPVKGEAEVQDEAPATEEEVTNRHAHEAVPEVGTSDEYQPTETSQREEKAHAAEVEAGVSSKQQNGAEAGEHGGQHEYAPTGAQQQNAASEDVSYDHGVERDTPTQSEEYDDSGSAHYDYDPDFEQELEEYRRAAERYSNQSDDEQCSSQLDEESYVQATNEYLKQNSEVQYETQPEDSQIFGNDGGEQARPLEYDHAGSQHSGESDDEQFFPQLNEEQLYNQTSQSIEQNTEPLYESQPEDGQQYDDHAEQTSFVEYEQVGDDQSYTKTNDDQYVEQTNGQHDEAEPEHSPFYNGDDQEQENFLDYSLTGEMKHTGESNDERYSSQLDEKPYVHTRQYVEQASGVQYEVQPEVYHDECRGQDRVLEYSHAEERQHTGESDDGQYSSQLDEEQPHAYSNHYAERNTEPLHELQPEDDQHYDDSAEQNSSVEYRQPGEDQLYVTRNGHKYVEQTNGQEYADEVAGVQYDNKDGAEKQQQLEYDESGEEESPQRPEYGSEGEFMPEYDEFDLEQPHEQPVQDVNEDDKENYYGGAQGALYSPLSSEDDAVAVTKQLTGYNAQPSTVDYGDEIGPFNMRPKLRTVKSGILKRPKNVRWNHKAEVKEYDRETGYLLNSDDDEQEDHKGINAVNSASKRQAAMPPPPPPTPLPPPPTVPSPAPAAAGFAFRGKSYNVIEILKYLFVGLVLLVLVCGPAGIGLFGVGRESAAIKGDIKGEFRGEFQEIKGKFHEIREMITPAIENAQLFAKATNERLERAESQIKEAQEGVADLQEGVAGLKEKDTLLEQQLEALKERMGKWEYNNHDEDPRSLKDVMLEGMGEGFKTILESNAQTYGETNRMLLKKAEAGFLWRLKELILGREDGVL